MNEWSVRVLTKAIFVPSGDQRGFVFCPHSLMNGTAPVSIGAGGFVGVTRAR